MLRLFNFNFISKNHFSFEMDNDDDDDTGFLLLYQILFERCANVYLNQNESYLLYEVNVV